jgi:hypothetical protein
MRRPLATIARFESRADAEQAHAQLTAAAIDSHLHYELPSQAGADPGALVIALRVPDLEAERAAHVLGGWGSAASGPGAPTRCLICQSSFVEVRPHSLPVRIGLALLLQAVPLPSAWFEPRGRRCGVCGHEWRVEGALGAS